MTKGEMAALAVISVLGGALLIYFFRQAAAITGPVEMSIHGWIAMGIGVVFSLAVGIGLMSLLFYSAHRGFDDRVQNLDDE